MPARPPEASASRSPAATASGQAPTRRAWIGLGANLGEPEPALAAALTALAALPDTRLVALSSLYRSAPVDAAGPDFLNAVAVFDTRLAPAELLAAMHTIEAAAGRERPYRNAPRALDLDLLLHGDTRSETAALTLPHPRMHLRAFVLAPLAELADDLMLPGHGPVATLLRQARNQRIERLPAGPGWPGPLQLPTN